MHPIGLLRTIDLDFMVLFPMDFRFQVQKSRLKPINSSKKVFLYSPNMAQNASLNTKLVFPDLHQVVCSSFLKFSTSVINFYLCQLVSCLAFSGSFNFFLFPFIILRSPFLPLMQVLSLFEPPGV